MPDWQQTSQRKSLSDHLHRLSALRLVLCMRDVMVFDRKAGSGSALRFAHQVQLCGTKLSFAVVAPMTGSVKRSACGSFFGVKILAALRCYCEPASRAPIFSQ
jgi:hypothetical protein